MHGNQALRAMSTSAGSIIANLRPCDMNSQCVACLHPNYSAISIWHFHEKWPNCRWRIDSKVKIVIVKYVQWQATSQPESRGLWWEFKRFWNPQYCISYFGILYSLPPIIINQLGLETLLVRVSWNLDWVAQDHIRASVVARILIFLWSTWLCHGVFHMAELCWA